MHGGAIDSGAAKDNRFTPQSHHLTQRQSKQCPSHTSATVVGVDQERAPLRRGLISDPGISVVHEASEADNGLAMDRGHQVGVEPVDDVALIVLGKR